MKYLYIDTTSTYLYTAVLEDNKVLSFVCEDLPMSLSNFTLKKINEMFNSINLDIKDIDEIIVVNGPGSFTGIRIGVTIAKTIAYTLNKKIKEISSLKAMALSINTNNIVVSLIDARRDFVYAGVYDNDKVLLNERYISIDELQGFINTLKREVIYVSNDNIDNINTIKYEPNYINIINYIKNINYTNYHEISPNYLKKTEAEEKLGDSKS